MQYKTLKHVTNHEKNLSNCLMIILKLQLSSVKWGHLGHFDPTPTNTISPTNPMGSSGTL